MTTQPHAAIIGAGIAGLTCARTLIEHGFKATIFEKSRGVGGRASTRRANALSFDHGAPHLRITDQWFAQRVLTWRDAGALGTRTLHRMTLDPRGEPLREDTSTVYVGLPHMSGLARHLAEGLDVRTEHRVAPLPAAPDSSGRWHLRDDAGEPIGAFDHVLCAAPAPQTQALLAEAHPAIAARCRKTAFAPSWALMLVTPSLVLPADKLIIEGAHPIDRVMTIAGAADPPCLIVHASTSWSLAHLEDTPEAVVALLCEALADLLGCDEGISPTHCVAHRWRFGQVTRDLHTPALYDPATRLGAAGDWCFGSTIEAACISGDALARYVRNPPPARF